MENQQPEALVLASLFERCVIAFGETETSSRAIAAKELRRLHTRVEELEKDLGNAKRLASKIWDKHPEARGTIEEGTGAWLVFGQVVETSGVSAQRVTPGKDHTEQQVRELLATGSQPQADALDTERLNWLIEQGCSNGVVYENVFGAFWMVWLDGDDVSKDKHQADRYPTARDAIDAAIAAAKESR